MNTSDDNALYRAVGMRIREARMHGANRLSQAVLAEKLGVSRASIVNIEAGRQHAPLFVLWRIAQLLDIELTALIPSRAELLAPLANVPLSESMVEQLRQVTNGDEAMERVLTTFIAQAVIQLTGPTAKLLQIKRNKST